jgi:hypothetical protein
VFGGPYVLRHMDEAKPSRPQRVTGLSLVAIISLAFAFVAVVGLHLLRTDLSPVQEVMSGYANGRPGNLMTLAFYALGVGSIAVGFRLRNSTTRTWVPRMVSGAVVLAGAGLIFAGIFEVERPGIPDTVEESVHSYGALVGFVLIVAAMVLFVFVCATDARWRQLLVPCLILAVLAVGAAAFSPVAPSTTFAGVAQRLLAIVVFGWVFLLAAWMRLGYAADSKLATGRM